MRISFFLPLVIGILLISGCGDTTVQENDKSIDGGETNNSKKEVGFSGEIYDKLDIISSDNEGLIKTRMKSIYNKTDKNILVFTLKEENREEFTGGIMRSCRTTSGNKECSYSASGKYLKDYAERPNAENYIFLLVVRKEKNSSEIYNCYTKAFDRDLKEALTEGVGGIFEHAGFFKDKVCYFDGNHRFSESALVDMFKKMDKNPELVTKN